MHDQERERPVIILAEEVKEAGPQALKHLSMSQGGGEVRASFPSIGGGATKKESMSSRRDRKGITTHHADVSSVIKPLSQGDAVTAE